MSLTDGKPAFSGGGSGRSGGGSARIGVGGNAAGSGGGPSRAPMGPPTAPPGYLDGGFQNNLSLYNSWYAPQMTGYQNQASNLANQLGALGAGFNQSAAGLNQQFASQQAQNQLGIASIGVDQAAIPRQQDYYNALFGIDRDKYNNNMGYQGQLKGFSTEDYNSVVKQLANQANQINYTADKNIRGVNSQATAAGSFTSAGTREGIQDVNADRGFGLEANRQQGVQANVGYRRDQAGITNTMNNLTSDFQAAGLTKDEQIARLNDRQQQLSIQAQQLGLKGDELAGALTSGLAKLNIDQALNVGQLMDSLYSNNAQQQQLAQQILIAAYQAGMG